MENKRFGKKIGEYKILKKVKGGNIVKQNRNK